MMNDRAILFFNWWGLLFLVIFLLGFGASHVFVVNELRTMDYIFRVVAFMALILIFILSGWKAGLLALPIGFFISSICAMMARYLRKDI